MIHSKSGQVTEKKAVIQYVCAECNKITKDVSEEDKVNPEVGVRISHGLCRDCYEKQMKKIRQTKS